jgi:hypothetical protein
MLVLPSAKIATWIYWIHLSHAVCDGNTGRFFASYTKTKTVESDV